MILVVVMGLKISRKCQKLPMLVVFAIFRPVTHHQNFFYKNFPQDFPQDCPQHFLQDFSPKIFLQDFPELDPDWLAPHHPIPNYAKFAPITAFLQFTFSPPPCPSRIYHKIFPQEFPTRFFHKIFPQEFPAKIFLQDFPKLDPDWLAPHHPIPKC